MRAYRRSWRTGHHKSYPHPPTRIFSVFSLIAGFYLIAWFYLRRKKATRRGENYDEQINGAFGAHIGKLTGRLISEIPGSPCFSLLTVYKMKCNDQTSLLLAINNQRHQITYQTANTVNERDLHTRLITYQTLRHTPENSRKTGGKTAVKPVHGLSNRT